jgi:hypothetical protein
MFSSSFTFRPWPNYCFWLFYFEVLSTVCRYYVYCCRFVSDFKTLIYPLLIKCNTYAHAFHNTCPKSKRDVKPCVFMCKFPNNNAHVISVNYLTTYLHVLPLPKICTNRLITSYCIYDTVLFILQIVL